MAALVRLFAEKWGVINLAVVAAASPGEVWWRRRERGGPCCWAWPPHRPQGKREFVNALLPVIAIRVCKTVIQFKKEGICFPS